MNNECFRKSESEKLEKGDLEVIDGDIDLVFGGGRGTTKATKAEEPSENTKWEILWKVKVQLVIQAMKSKLKMQKQSF